MTMHVAVYDTRTGKKRWVPARWVDHPRLGKHLSKTPRQKARDTKAASVAAPEKAPAAGDTEKE